MFNCIFTGIENMRITYPEQEIRYTYIFVVIDILQISPTHFTNYIYISKENLFVALIPLPNMTGLGFILL